MLLASYFFANFPSYFHSPFTPFSNPFCVPSSTSNLSFQTCSFILDQPLKSSQVLYPFSTNKQVALTSEIWSPLLYRLLSNLSSSNQFYIHCYQNWLTQFLPYMLTVLIWILLLTLQKNACNNQISESFLNRHLQNLPHGSLFLMLLLKNWC